MLYSKQDVNKVMTKDLVNYWKLSDWKPDEEQRPENRA